MCWEATANVWEVGQVPGWLKKGWVVRMRADYTLYYTTPCWFPLMRPIISQFLSYNQKGSILLSSHAPRSGNHYQAQKARLVHPLCPPHKWAQQPVHWWCSNGRGERQEDRHEPTERGEDRQTWSHWKMRVQLPLMSPVMILAEATLEQPQNVIYIKGRNSKVSPILDWDSLTCKTASQGSSLRGSLSCNVS